MIDLGIGGGGITHCDTHGKGGCGDTVDPCLVMLKGGDDGLDPVLGFFCGDIGHEEQKFVTTHTAAWGIGGVRPEDIAHEMKGPVTGVMAVDVVDDPEIVEVDEGEGAALFAHPSGDDGLAGAAVHEAGDDVGFFNVLRQEGAHDFPEHRGGGFNAPVVILGALPEDFVKHAVIPNADENVHETWIELLVFTLDELIADVVVIAGLAIDAVGTHGVEGVRDGDDPGFLGDFSALESEGIALAVVALMVAAGHILRGPDHSAVLEDVAAHHGMGLDDVVLRIRQALWVVQYGIGHTDFADVVKHGSVTQVVDLLGFPVQCPGNQHRVLAYAGGVSLGVGIFCVNGAGEGLNGLVGHLFDFLRAGLSDRRLPGNFGVQLFRVLVFQQYAPVVLDHGNGGKSGHAGIEYREAHEEGIRIKGPHILFERGIEHDEKKDSII